MILDKKVKIRVHSKNRNQYKENKIGDMIDVSVSELPMGSNVKINVRCDNEPCSIEKQIPYYDYNQGTKQQTRNYYCKKCAYIHRQNTLMKKHGVTNVMYLDNVKKKHQNKVENVDFDKADKKRKATNLERYGVEYVQQNSEINKKSQKTTKERYGVDFIFHTDENKQKTIDILKNVNNIESRKQKQHKVIIDKISKKYNIEIESYNGDKFSVNCKKGHIYKIDDTLLTNRTKLNTTLCTICNKIDTTDSYSENVVKDFIKTLSINFLPNSNILGRKELDIYIPDYNLAIEYNGVYWHSEKFKDKDYHLNKSLKCNEKGVELIHIFEDDWLHKEDIIKSILMNRLGKIGNKIYARQCEIKEVKSNVVRDFLDKNHIQGFSSSSYKLGLYFKGELVSLMTFGYRRTNAKKEFELIRFCNKLNTNVVGASSKLFKHFLKNYEIDESYILSYADYSMFNGKMYDMLGFDRIHLTKPNYFWVINGNREHRWKYNKQKLIKDGFDSNLTEVQIMHSRNYHRIYGCGQIRYEYHINKKSLPN